MSGTIKKVIWAALVLMVVGLCGIANHYWVDKPDNDAVMAIPLGEDGEVLTTSTTDVIVWDDTWVWE